MNSYKNNNILIKAVGLPTFFTLTLCLTINNIIFGQTAPPGESTVPQQHSETAKTSPETAQTSPIEPALPQVILPEGYMIIGRVAKLVKLPDDDRWFLAFEEALADKQKQPQVLSSAIITNNQTDKPHNPSTDLKPSEESARPWSVPMEVLPGKWLSAMTKVVNEQMDMSVDFRIWAEVTTYQNRNYVLPRMVATLSLFGRDSVGSPGKKQPKPPAFILGPTTSQSPAGNPASSPPADSQDNSLLPEKLRQTLLSIPRSRPLELPGEINHQSLATATRENSTLETNKPALEFDQNRPLKKITSSQKIASDKLDQLGAEKTAQILPEARVIPSEWKDGYMVIDRVGRALYFPGSQLCLFEFEADGASLAEPPVVLLACQLREVVERTIGTTTESIKFRVSGPISRYQGGNYLLLRKVLIVHDLGNLGK